MLLILWEIGESDDSFSNVLDIDLVENIGEKVIDLKIGLMDIHRFVVFLHVHDKTVD